MAEEKKLSAAEIRGTISTSLATAFGFVIGLLWNNVVMGGLGVAGINMSAGTDMPGWIVLVITAVAITIVMVVLIIVISRWGNKKQ